MQYFQQRHPKTHEYQCNFKHIFYAQNHAGNADSNVSYFHAKTSLLFAVKIENVSASSMALATD